MNEIEKEIASTKAKIEEIISSNTLDFKDLFDEKDIETLKKYSKEFMDFLLEKKEMPVVFLLIAFIAGIIFAKVIK